ncbi:MAG: hypothetical protein NUV68_08055, partial [Caldiserica bacterium]|nr:hypothetical protein [Caldisericota bacterium]
FGFSADELHCQEERAHRPNFGVLGLKGLKWRTPSSGNKFDNFFDFEYFGKEIKNFFILNGRNGRQG